jgi:hypothetical protein
MREVLVPSVCGGLLVLVSLVGCGSVGGGAAGNGGSGDGGSGGGGSGGSDAGTSDAGGGGTGGGAGDGGADARADQSTSSDAPAEASADGNTCPGDGTAASEPFAGVWTDTQNNETWTVTNNAGCSTWVGQMAGNICDYCSGTYTTTGATTAVLTLSCVPRSTCSVSGVHTDTGTLTLSGCSFTYAYNYGGGSATQTVTKTAATTINVCGSIDAGGN